MRYKTKIAIFLVAILLTFIGFNLMIPRTVVDMVTIGNPPDYAISIHVVAERAILPLSSTTG